MQPLITPNQLLEMLIAEVNKFDFQSYQKLLLRKAEINQEIRKRRTTRSLSQLQLKITELKDRILPQQIAVISYYTERIPRIKRIIELLKTSRFRARAVKTNILLRFRTVNILGVTTINKDYNKIISLLQILVEAEKAGILKTLESQKSALEKQDYKKYLKNVNLEIGISKMLFNRISSFGISISQEIRKMGVTPKTISIPMKKRLVIALAIIAISLVACSSINDKQGERAAKDYPPIVAKDYPPIVRTVGHCTYTLGIVFKGDNDPQHFFRVLDNYYKNDLKHELEIEKQFEEQTGLNVYGEYTENDLLIIMNFLLRTYNSKI